MIILTVHGVDDASTNFANGLHANIQKLIPGANVEYNSIVWSDATSGILNEYRYLSAKKPYFWNVIARAVHPLAIQIIDYVHNKRGSSNIVHDIDSDFRRAIGDEKDVIIVAHSLGAVIMFDYLSGFANKQPPEGLRIGLVTVGAPLPIFWAGMGHLEILSSPKVRFWSNVYSRRDPIAGSVEKFTPDAEELLVNTGFLPLRAHTRYWKNKKIAQHIADKVLSWR